VRDLAVFIGFALATGCEQDQAVKAVNADPVAEIYSPAADAELKEGVFFLASGRVSDEDDPTEQLKVIWFMGGETRCPEATPMADGRTECGMAIGSADVQIALLVTDPNDAEYQASVSVRSVPATGPTVQIIEPSQSSYIQGEKILFQATVSDGEDVASALRVWWTSDLDDDLDIDLAQDDDGSVIGYYDGLTMGSHVLRLWVEDTSGRANSAEVIVEILPVPAPPSVVIVSPADDSTVMAGTAVVFQATTLDETTPSAALGVEWTSSIDEVLSTAAPDDTGDVLFTLSELSVGVHEIILTVTDGDGMTNSERVTLTVSEAEDTG
jgi:hypothetical protein